MNQRNRNALFIATSCDEQAFAERHAPAHSHTRLRADLRSRKNAAKMGHPGY
jgi:hypothetical protein